MSKEAFEFFRVFATSHNLYKAQDSQWSETCRVMCLLMRSFREHRYLAGYGHSIHETARYVSFLTTGYPQLSDVCLHVISTYDHRAYLDALKSLADKLYDILQQTSDAMYDYSQYPLYSSLPMPFTDISARYHFFDLIDMFTIDGVVDYDGMKGYVSDIDNCWSVIVDHSRKICSSLDFIESSLDSSISDVMQDPFESHVWMMEKQLCVRLRRLNERIKYAHKNHLSYRDLRNDVSDIEQSCYGAIDLWSRKDGTHYSCSSVIDSLFVISSSLDTAINLIR